MCISEQKIERLISLAKQKSSNNKKVVTTKTKGEVPIRPVPVLSATPVKIGVPVVHTIPDNVQMCVVPALNTRTLLQITSVGHEDCAVKSVVPIPK